MTGFFENLSLVDDGQKVASRKALALAKRRAELQFGQFMAACKTAKEVEVRLSYLDEDLRGLVQATCDETGSEDMERIYITLKSSLNRVADICEDCKGDGCTHCENSGKQSSTHLARRPKMCPYHREVTDISLASGDPTSGFTAMNHATFGEQSCRGQYGGTCNWKPEMVTKSFWDDRAKNIEDRRVEREQQTALPDTPFEFEGPELDEGWDDSNMGDEGHDINSELAEAPSAVGAPEMAVAASHQAGGHKPGCECGFCKNKGKLPGTKSEDDDSDSDSDSFDSGSDNTHEAAGATLPAHTGPIERVDLQRSEGPSPKMDKREWTPENVRFLDDVDSSKGPHPTVEQDITQPTDYKGDPFSGDDGRFEQTDSVLEKQKLPKNDAWDAGGFNKDKNTGDSGKTKTFPKGNQKNPVTRTKQTSRTAAFIEQPLIHAGSLEPLRAIAQRKPGLTFDGMPFEQWEPMVAGIPVGQHQGVEVAHPNPKWENVASEVLRTGTPGPLRAALQKKPPMAQPGQIPGQPPGGLAPPEMGQQQMASANPIRDLLHAQFPSEIDVQRAIEDYQG